MKMLSIDLPKSRAQAVAQRLRQAIIDGEIALGAFIAEERLAEMFGVSRTPVREALSQLQLQGLVVVRPQVGSFVFRPGPSDIAALCEYRIALEPQAAILAHKHNPEQAIAGMRKAIASMKSAVEKRDTVAYGRGDTVFHEGLVEASGNPHVIAAYHLVAGRISALRTALSAPIDIDKPGNFQQHETLLQHFMAGEMVAYTALMERHISLTGRVYGDALRKLQLSEEPKVATV